MNRSPAFSTPSNAPQVFDRLLGDLETIVIPNLQRFPQIGSAYIDAPPQSTEALMAIAKLPRDAVQSLR